MCFRHVLKIATLRPDSDRDSARDDKKETARDDKKETARDDKRDDGKQIYNIL